MKATNTSNDMEKKMKIVMMKYRRDKNIIKRVNDWAILKRLGLDHFGKGIHGAYSTYENWLYMELRFLKGWCNTNDIEELMRIKRQHTLPRWCGTAIGRSQKTLRKMLPELLVLKLIKDNGKKYELTALGQKKLKQYEKRQAALLRIAKEYGEAREHTLKAATRKQPIGYG